MEFINHLRTPTVLAIPEAPNTLWEGAGGFQRVRVDVLLPTHWWEGRVHPGSPLTRDGHCLQREATYALTAGHDWEPKHGEGKAFGQNRMGKGPGLNIEA